MRTIFKVVGAIGVIAVAGAGIRYSNKDDAAKYERMTNAQTTVLKLTGTENFNTIKNDIDKKTDGFFIYPTKQTRKTDAWEKTAVKAQQEHARIDSANKVIAEKVKTAVDSTQEAMNKLLKEKVQAAVDSVKKAQKAVIKKAKSIGKKGTKHAKNAKITNKKHTNTVHKTIHKAAKKLVKQTSKHIKK